MDECDHYSIRGDVARHREKEPMMNYPFTLPQGLTREQIRNLLPLMASRKCKRWECHQCVKEFMEQDCPHDGQLAIQPATSVAEPNLDVALVTKTNRSIVEIIDAVEVLICTEDSLNAEVECITKKQQPAEPKVFFDLNVPINESCDEALEKSNKHDPATEELAVAYNPEHTIAELVSVDQLPTKSLEAEPETSAKVPNNGIGNSNNVSPSPEILVPGVNRRSSIKKARKYHSLSFFINEEGKREGSPNVLNSYPQCNDRTKLKKNKKKMQRCGTVEEGSAGTKIFEATEGVSKQNRQNRILDCHLPPKQICTLANVSSPIPRRESNGKRKHSINHDQNGNYSDATKSNSSEKGLRNEAGSVDIQLRKRRIFCSITKTPLTDADQSQEVELDADRSQCVDQTAADHFQQVVEVGDKSKKTALSSSEGKEILIIPYADHGNSRPARIKKATGKAASCQLMFGRKQKMLQDKSSISTIAKDVPMPCLQNDNFNLNQLKSEIKTRLLRQGSGFKRLKVDLPSSNNNQNDIPNCENRAFSPTQFESGGKGKGDTNLKLGYPLEKKKEIDKSSLKEVKRRGRPKRVPMSGFGIQKEQGNEQSAAFGKELVVKDVTGPRPILCSETALQLLSMVAVDTLENEALTDSGLDYTILPIMEEFHVPPVRNVLEMGYEGCIEVKNPADYFLVDGEGDRFKLGEEDLPLRPHRFLPAQGILPVSGTV